MENLGSNQHLSPKFVKFVLVWAKNICKLAFEKYSFTNVGDFAESPALLVICITFVLSCVEAVQNDQERKDNGDGGKYSHGPK